MNCKQGDFAVVVGGKVTDFLGRVVECVEPTTDRWTGAPGWIVKPPLGNWRGARDTILRPIRDPGDDAKDETLDWLPVPQKEIA